MKDYCIRIIPFPAGVTSNGMILPNDDDTYSIYLNARATWEQQIVALDHELEHLRNNDLYNSKSIREIEKNF